MQTMENLITFGDWLARKRADLGYGLLALQRMTNVSNSTLSRVERQITEPTLYTATRICHGLGVTLSDLLSELQAQDISPISDSWASTKLPDVMTIEDIQLLSDTYFGYPAREDVREILRNMADDILQNAERNRLKVISGEGNFLDEEFDRLLQGSTLVQLELREPPTLDAQDVSRMFTRGGVIALKEVGLYTKALREQGLLQASNLQKLSKSSVSILLRLENGETDHITLKEALVFSGEMGQESVVQQMFWRACNFHWRFLQFDVCTKFPPVLQESQVIARARLVSILFTLSRWQERLIPDNKQWLYDLRNRLEQIRQDQSQVRPLF
jgi:transcriptional regulator with XRE-family HTH domain